MYADVRKPAVRLRNGTGFNELYREMKQLEEELKKIPVPRFNQCPVLSAYVDKTNKYRIKVSRNFVREMYKLNINEARKCIDNYMFVIARGQLNGRSFI